MPSYTILVNLFLLPLTWTIDLEPARILLHPDSVYTVSKGGVVRMRCSAYGNPAPQIHWQFNGQKVEELDKYVVVTNEVNNQYTGELEVRNLDMDDQGNYTCVANNGGDDHPSTRAELIVKNEATIINGPKTVTLEVHEQVTLECRVVYDFAENSTFKVLWQKDGQDVHIDGKRIIKQDADNGEYGIQITRAVMEDSGEYTCNASTASSYASESGELTITGIPPELEGGSGKKTVIETVSGDQLKLNCSFKREPHPKPNVTWYRDDFIKTNPIYTDTEKYSVCHHHHHLTINTITNDEDSVTFRCHARNDEGEDTKNVKLVVWSRTNITGKKVDYPYQEGDTVVLDGQYRLDPALEEFTSVDWYQGERKLNLSTGDEIQVTDTREDDGDENGSGVHTSDDEEEEDKCQGDRCITLLPNNSLLITDMKAEHIGQYRFVVNVEKPGMTKPHVVQSEPSSIYCLVFFCVIPWWGLLIIIIAVVILLIILCIFCCCCCCKDQPKPAKDEEAPENESLLPQKQPKKLDDPQIVNGASPPIIVHPPDDVYVKTSSAPLTPDTPVSEEKQQKPSDPSPPSPPHTGACPPECRCPKRQLSIGTGSEREVLTICDFQTKNIQDQF